MVWSLKTLNNQNHVVLPSKHSTGAQGTVADINYKRSLDMFIYIYSYFTIYVDCMLVWFFVRRGESIRTSADYMFPQTSLISASNGISIPITLGHIFQLHDVKLGVN